MDIVFVLLTAAVVGAHHSHKYLLPVLRATRSQETTQTMED